MKRVCGWALLLAVPLTVALAMPAAAGKPPAPRLVRLTGPVWTTAMDGPQVAFNSPSGNPSCWNKVFLWNVISKHMTRVSGSDTCTVADLVVPQVAVANDRAAWIVRTAGNTEWLDRLYLSSLSKPNETLLARADRFSSDCTTGRCMQGAWINGLVGSGKLLAVSRWSTGADGTTLLGGGLYVIDAKQLRRIVEGPSGIVAVAADSGRIAVLRAGGVITELFRYTPEAVVIYSSTGKLLRTLTSVGIRAVKIDPRAEVALRGNYLGILTTTGKLELYSWRSGRRLHRWSVGGGATNLDLFGQYASYIVSHRSVHVRHLESGRDRVLARTGDRTGLGFVAAEIEQPGLVYALDPGGGRGTLFFVPMAPVLAAFS